MAGEDDPISAWLRGQGVEEASATAPRPARRVWALAALPWVAVLGLLLALLGGVGRSDRPGGAATRTAASSQTAPGPGENAAPSAQVTAAAEPGQGDLDAPHPADAAPVRSGMAAGAEALEPASQMPGLDPAVGAAAVLTVLDALLRADADGTRRVVEHAVVDTSTRRGDLDLVAVRVVLREGDADGWRTTRTARYGVPIEARDGPPRPMGPPWPLPARALEVASPPWQGPEQPPDAAELIAALAAAGWIDVAIEGLRTAPEIGVLELQVRGVPPDGERAAEHLVWVDAVSLTVLDPSPPPAAADTGDAASPDEPDPEELP